jgi:serine/threonine protein kinase/tetratricopeptide (TPR) repeat protein
VSVDEDAAKVFGALRERIDRGERVDVEDALRAHPELAAALRRQFAAMRLAEGLFGGGGAAGEDAAELVGTSLGPWRLDAVLGSGGMGTVFDATHGAERAAVKVLHPHLAARRGFIERFLREADAGRRVRHPNVVATLGAGTTQADGSTVHYLVMERVEGRTLRALLEESGRLPEALCRHVGREAARALAAIHAEGFVHRDVKPENLIVTPEHVVKVMDLGVARLLDDDLHVSQTGAFVGSARYAAPEQFAGGSASLDARADLYALGLTLYEAATGGHPFPDTDFHVVLKRQLTEMPRRAGEANPQLSAFLEEFLVQLLAKDRDRRPADADLVARILDEGEDSAWWRERARALREETRRPLRRMRIPRETALHGRESELALLRSLYERASQGDGQVALIEGEAGIGKSRLVDEFVANLAASGEDVDFLFGSYPPGGAATASGAFAIAYRERLGDDEAAIRAALPQTPLLVPAFSALLRGDAAPPGAEALTKDSLQAVFVHATRSFAAARTTIVLIDDLHFAPEEGRALFAALALASAGHRILLVGAARPGLDPAWIAQIERLARAPRLVLPRLSPKVLVRLLADSLGSTHLAEELAGKIAAKSDGNPFFVFEILRGLREGQFLTRKPDGTWATTRLIAEIQVPSSVVELVQARVSDLDRADRNVLEAAACVGFEFDPALVGDVLQIPRIPLLQTLGAIEKSHRLVRSSGRRFVFDHHQVMEVLYAGLSEPLREEYHASIATALETRSGAASRKPADLDGALCAAVADHLLKGGRGPRAVRYLDRARAHLEGAYVNGAAVDLIDRALAVPGLFAGAERAEILLRKIARLDLMARRGEQRAAIDEAMALADAAGDGSRSARVHRALGLFFMQVSRPADAEPVMRRAMELAREAGDEPTELAAALDLGKAAGYQERTAEARERLAQGVAQCRRLGLRREEAAAMTSLGNAFHNLGLFAEAVDHHTRALAIFREVGDRRGESVALGHLGNAAYALGRNEEAIEYQERRLALSREIGDRIGEGFARGNIGAALSALGRMAEALVQTELGAALFRECNNPRQELTGIVNAGIFAMYCGRPADSRERLERALALSREIGSRYVEGLALQYLASLSDDAGDVVAAERLLVEALEVRRAIGARGGEADTLCVLGALRARLGRTAEARADLEAALAIAREVQPGLVPLAAASLACLPGGDVAAALQALAAHESGATVADAMQARLLLWRKTGDRSLLEEANRSLTRVLASARPEEREAMLGGFPLYRDVAEAARANGL